MALRLIVSMEALPGRQEDMLATYADLCPSVREELGCLQFEMYRDIERLDRFVLVERWTDPEALAAHGTLLRERGLELSSLRQVVETERYVS